MNSNKPFALITGASTGLGKYLAQECARENYPIVLVALADTGLNHVAEVLRTRYKIEVHALEVDLSKEEGPSIVFEYCTTNNLNVGVLINNAGIGYEAGFSTLSLDFCTGLLHVNMLAVVKLTSLFLPQLQAQPRAYILNVSSMASYLAMPFKGIYAASKAFVRSFSRSLNTELRNSTVTVSTLCPGAVPTNDLIRSRIRQHGWLATASQIQPDVLAKIAIAEMFKGKALIVPGWINRISRLTMQLIPETLRQSILYRNYKKADTAVA